MSVKSKMMLTTRIATHVYCIGQNRQAICPNATGNLQNGKAQVQEKGYAQVACGIVGMVVTHVLI